MPLPMFARLWGSWPQLLLLLLSESCRSAWRASCLPGATSHHVGGGLLGTCKGQGSCRGHGRVLQLRRRGRERCRLRQDQSQTRFSFRDFHRCHDSSRRPSSIPQLHIAWRELSIQMSGVSMRREGVWDGERARYREAERHR